MALISCFATLTLLCLTPLGVIGENIAEVATNEGLSTLVDLVSKAGLVETLTGEGPFTVFAPTNEAFAKLPQEILDALDSDTELLKKVLLYHVIPAKVGSGDVQNDVMVASAEGTELRTNVYLRSDFYPGFITINGKRVARADIEADNGVIHTLTDVIYPFPMDTVMKALEDDSEGRFSTLIAAVDAADLRETLEGSGPFTLFAPTNDAFAKIPEETLQGLLNDKDALAQILLRHVVPGALFRKGISWMIHDTAGGEQVQTQVFKGGVVKVVSLEGGASITDVDIITKNGVVHAIDTVI